MGNATENEDESAKPLPHSPATDVPLEAQQVPVEQLDHASPTRPVPRDQDEPCPSENGNLLSAAPKVNIVELKSGPQQFHFETPSSDNGLQLKSNLQKSQTEAAPTDNIVSDPPQSQTDAAINDNTAEFKANTQQPKTETVPNDNSAELKTNIEQSQTETVLNDDSVGLKTSPQNPQAEAAPNGNDVNLRSSPKQHHTEAAPSDNKSVELKASSQVEAAHNDNDGNLRSSPKQHLTEAAPSDKSVELKSASHEPPQGSPSPSPIPLDDEKGLLKPETEPTTEANEIFYYKSRTCGIDGTTMGTSNLETSKLTADAKVEPSEVPENKSDHNAGTLPKKQNEPVTPHAGSSSIKTELENKRELKNEKNKTDIATPKSNGNSSSKHSFLLDDDHDGNESGTEEEQWTFMKELENFFRERSMEFKPPKFYGEGLNCLKLWRAVMRLGGYDKVTSCKLWRQVGESFKPPKTCTTVSWTFRGFYEKALLDYERHKTCGGELNVSLASNSEPMNVDNQAPGSGRARRDAAARAMQGWHSQRLLGNGEVSDPIIKDKNSLSLQKREKQLKSLGLLKRKKPSYMEHAVKAARTKTSKPQLDVEVVDLGPPADWVKINVQRMKDCFEVYALVPGLLREEVRVQSDPAGRLVISGEPEHPDNPWGVTPFRKVVSLPSRIDPHQTSAVVTLHGQLFIRVPFEQSD
ncbi:hypothetical protein P3X46_015755 [Hevea brasiliensis]|uniref:ARID domain-containing protein n=1 Tax=Hevea brasiliensis TaxID=3981 RepID=A0ABQ9M088_HEVBR|nr:AT-rich interactive domain-containing protein 6 [Hevea brasiliensis]KAJ9172525.1 hypothetical protein P3X46_015755 [Hevea brasiliensis]